MMASHWARPGAFWSWEPERDCWKGQGWPWSDGGTTAVFKGKYECRDGLGWRYAFKGHLCNSGHWCPDGQKKPRDEWQAEERLEKLQQLMTGLYLWSLRVPRADGEDKVVQHQGSLEREHFKRCGNNYQVGWGLKRSIGLSPERFHWRFTECCYTFLLTLPFELIMDSQIIVCILQRGPWTIIMLPQCDILHSNNIKTWKLTWHNTMNWTRDLSHITVIDVLMEQWGQEWAGQGVKGGNRGMVESKYLLYSALLQAWGQTLGTVWSPVETLTSTGSGWGFRQGEAEVKVYLWKLVPVSEATAGLEQAQ